MVWCGWMLRSVRWEWGRGRLSRDVPRKLRNAGRLKQYNRDSSRKDANLPNDRSKRVRFRKATYTASNARVFCSSNYRYKTFSRLMISLKMIEQFA